MFLTTALRRADVAGVLVLVIALMIAQAGRARAEMITTFLGGSINTAGNWSDGLPSSARTGYIAVDGQNTSTVFNFGSGSVVNQAAGTITSSDGFNLTGGTWNMSGGGIVTRYFLSNQGSTVINLSDGLVELADRTGTQHMGVANNGTLNISGSAMLDGTQATTNVQRGGTINFDSGWTGYWTYGMHNAEDAWRTELTTYTGTYKLDGASITPDVFDTWFLVSADHMTLSVIPEPTTWLLLLSALACGLLVRRR